MSISAYNPLMQVDAIVLNDPVWSPDGEMLAFWTFVPNTRIWTVDPQGNNLQELLGSWDGTKTMPQWRYNSEEILFISNINGLNDTWVFNQQTQNIINLTEELEHHIIRNSESPDGTKLAIVTFEESSVPTYELLIYFYNTKEFQVISEVTTTRIPQISWSPDSKKLAYSLTPFSAFSDESEGQLDIFSFESLTQTNIDINPDSPVIWLSNNQIAFFERCLVEGITISLHSLDTNITDDLTNGRCDASLVSSLTINSSRNLLAYISQQGISLIDVLNKDFSVLLDGDPSSFSGLSWSPQGEQIAFIWSENENSNIWIINSNSGSLISLTRDS